jgi:hypothetical protein
LTSSTTMHGRPSCSTATSAQPSDSALTE